MPSPSSIFVAAFPPHHHIALPPCTITTELSDFLPCTPRTIIMGLPSKILREILVSVDGEYSKTLWSLCLTCKHFRNNVEKHGEPEYNLRGKQIEDTFEISVQMRDQPHLRKLMRSVRLNLGSAAHSTCAKEEMLALASSLGLKYQPTALFSGEAHWLTTVQRQSGSRLHYRMSNLWSSCLA